MIADAAPAGCAGLALLLSRRGVAAHAFDPRGALRAAELASLPCDLVVRTEVVLSPADVALARRVATIARRLVVHDGATTTTAVAAVAGASATKVRRLLEVEPSVTWLDPTRVWLVVPTKRTRVATAVRKLLAVRSRLPLADVGAALERLPTPVRLPPHTLRALCCSYDWATVDPGRDVIAANGLSRRDDPLSRVERLLVDVLEEVGPVASYAQILDAAEHRGMRRLSAPVCLSRSPVFQHVGRARYATIGHLAPVIPLQADQSRERAADAAHRLSDPLLVLDEREADVALAVGAEAAAGAHRDVSLTQQPERELL